jgi:hypothetical protein
LIDDKTMTYLFGPLDDDDKCLVLLFSHACRQPSN